MHSFATCWTLLVCFASYDVFVGILLNLKKLKDQILPATLQEIFSFSCIEILCGIIFYFHKTYLNIYRHLIAFIYLRMRKFMHRI